MMAASGSAAADKTNGVDVCRRGFPGTGSYGNRCITILISGQFRYLRKLLAGNIGSGVGQFRWFGILFLLMPAGRSDCFEGIFYDPFFLLTYVLMNP